MPTTTDCLSWDRANVRWGRFPGERNWRSPGFDQTNDHPVVCINWPEAKAFADWLARRTGKSYRLLTDAEWEFVVRAGTTTRRWFGDGRERVCDFANVWEWTEDCFAPPQLRSARMGLRVARSL